MFSNLRRHASIASWIGEVAKLSSGNFVHCPYPNHYIADDSFRTQHIFARRDRELPAYSFGGKAIPSSSSSIKNDKFKLLSLLNLRAALPFGCSAHRD